MEQRAFATESESLISRAPQSAFCRVELGTLSSGDIELDPERRTVKKSGHLVHLTPKEFELTRQLMSQAGRPIRHALLLDAVWGSGYGRKPEYLRTFVCQLRKKLEDDPENPQYFLTHSHFGYCFADAL
jgi:two-component system KDP operon response regulator KdpE